MKTLGRYGKLVLLFCVLVSLAASVCGQSCCASSLIAPKADRIQPRSENPWYWQYKGKPVVLVGGSKEDNLFQIPDLKEQLDLLASVGGNYIRNTMSSRDLGNVWPFLKLENGKYDLDQYNPEYWKRFENLLKWTYERDIIIQIELWDQFDYMGGIEATDSLWVDLQPYNPNNNVNYTVEETGLSEPLGHLQKGKNGFFRSVPALDDIPALLKYQQKQVDKILELSLPYPNVLYTIDNETHGPQEWGQYWARYIYKKAEALGVDVYVTEMWNDRDLTSWQQKQTLDHPDIYPFVDISQNSRHKDQTHWDNIMLVRDYLAGKPRPLNNVKIYGGMDAGWGSGTARDGAERFWRDVIGGCASARMHRPEYGLGLSETSQACLKSVRMLLAELDIARCRPDAKFALLQNREDDEAYLTCIPGKQYAVYFTDGGEVTLNLAGTTGTLQLKWLDIMKSRWVGETTVQAGKTIDLKAPDKGHWVALIVAQQPSGAQSLKKKIAPCPENPYYWQYKGEPLVLLGGSKTDNLFQQVEFGLEEHLDDMVKVGANYVRNQMHARYKDQGDVYPFLQLPNGKFDLDQFNPEYWRRLETFLNWTDQRDIIVQIELWDRFQFSPEGENSKYRLWNHNPFNPDNNINYDQAQSGLIANFTGSMGQDNPFFRSMPELENKPIVLKYQRALVGKILSYTLQHDNVLYNIDNETYIPEEWAAYWRNFIHDQAEKAGKEVQITEMWGDINLKGEIHRLTFDHPELYSFVDISQNNNNKGDKHWENLQWVREYLSKKPRPMNNVKIYGGMDEWWGSGTPNDGVERFWRNLIGGAAGARMHRPPHGRGLDDLAKKAITSARMLLKELDITHCTPDAKHQLLVDRQEDEAYATCDPGKQYALYFTDGGELGLDLSRAQGSFTLKWLDIMQGKWSQPKAVQGGSILRLAAPAKGHWIALITR